MMDAGPKRVLPGAAIKDIGVSRDGTPVLRQ